MSPTLFAQVLDPAHRADPYPLYEALRRSPVSRQDDGTWVVSSHAAIARLLHDPRISSEDLPDPPLFRWTGHPIQDLLVRPIRSRIVARHRPFIFRDPPDHDLLRRHVMREFSPGRVRRMRRETEAITGALLDRLEGRAAFDLVEDVSYPLPVTVICDLLGVPREDEPRFQGWATQLATALEPNQRTDAANAARNEAAFTAISDYLRGLIRERRASPRDDMLSGLAAGRDGERMNDYDLVATAVLLLVAGHETTVNLITNGILTLLRFPEHAERLRREPEIAPRLIEELLRYEPPVHYRTRLALADIGLGDATIPEGAPVVLLLAAGNRDPARFRDPDRFDPDREDNRHLGFGGGLHYCVGAPLARIEAEVALTAIVRRLPRLRLLDDPPPYRPGASLRGPRRLRLAVEAPVGAAR
ncbi:cytochrome P450 [Methylobacterium oryzihabitans]|uniref:Cytochrome P450 n=1 Tax=Methylobacterium oryzihabitans TaxID=2499852 RepID=A0A3S3U4L0_9HYPH|nr:cytochrome P450 [Methylobacterium oryzihabitans]RVU15442.1 cytochrome P450 [Methylobacterium oryzihabitans]